MKKALYEQRGPIPKEVIQAVEFEKPVLEPGQVLVEVLAAPINPSDLLTLTGQYGILPPLPAIGGSEGVGRVIELGPDVQNPPVGQTVLLPIGIGTWRTHLAVDANTLMPMPNEADPKQLAMITVNPPTAALMLSEFVDLEQGDWVIQNTANSGVGTYLVQLAKIRGFKTVNIVRRESAVAGVQENGGDVTLVDGEDLAKRVAEATGGAKIKLGVDAVGGEATTRIANCLCEEATIVSYGAMSGKPYSLPATEIIFKDITFKGFWLAKWFKTASQEQRMAVFGELTQMIASGKLQSNIQATYDIDHIKEAVAAASQGERDGKIMVVPNG